MRAIGRDPAILFVPSHRRRYAFDEGGTMTAVLEAERQTYEAHKDELLREGSGKYVLIHKDEIAGIFDSKMDAVHEGYRRFGNVPFLVKQILSVEVPIHLTSSLILI